MELKYYLSQCIKMDEVTAYPLLFAKEINHYLKNFEELGGYKQIQLIKSALTNDKFFLYSEKKFVTRLTNESTGDKGIRIDFVYHLNFNRKIIIQSFFDERETQETTAYVVQGNELIYEYFTNDVLIKSDYNRFIRNIWNGDVILSERDFERKELSWY